MLYSRGSEWHRWDLHLHTPGTKKHDSYQGSTPQEKWEKFYERINAYINEHKQSSDIVAIGITDYCSIDNYKKVVADKQLPNQLFLLPNVEMRLCVKSEKSPINIHFLFDPDYIDQVEEEFFTDLKFSYNDNTYNATTSSLTKMGEDFSKTRSDSSENNYLTGLDRFVPSLDSFKAVFKSHPKLREHTLIGVANSSRDGASGIKGETLSAYRDTLYQFCDFIFSGREKDRKYFLGEGVDDSDQIIKRYGSLMPCLHGSDAHKLEKIFEPDMGRYCWIKAEPTFNGLRQVLYEPKSRVLISQQKPEAKSSYKVIESIQFNDDNFNDVAIPLNPNLNCIIGGRSTGKTCLLHNLANAVDSAQTTKREQNAANSSKFSVNATVKWADESQDDTHSGDDQHKIMYIPQSYLNRLSENTDYSDINEIIEPIVLANADNLSAKETMDRRIGDITHKVDNESLRLRELIQKLRTLKAEMSEIGTEEGIAKEKKKLEEQIETHKLQNMNSKEVAESYNNAKQKLNHCRMNLKTIREDKGIIKTVDSIIEKAEPWPILGVEPAKIELDKAWEEIRRKSQQIWQTHKQIILNNLIKEEHDLFNAQEKAKQNVKRLKPDLDKSTELKNLTELYTDETQTLETFRRKKKQIKNIDSEIGDCIKNLFSCHASFEKEGRTYADVIASSNGNNSDGTNNVVLGADAVYMYKDLASKIVSFVDGRKLRSRKVLHSFIEAVNEGDSLDSYPQQAIQDLIYDSIEDETLIKGSIDQFVSEIFENHTVIKYKATLDGDELPQMSPGKKALVYLKLLIELDTSKSPILIDQPEDDLDNRSIFYNLIPFLKNKKRDRQMIIVTHNANVVLGADAEEIIVANQEGEDSPNLNRRFEYISGAIEDDLAQNVKSKGVLQRKSIQQHICEVLEGGRRAFEMRRRKYTALFD